MKKTFKVVILPTEKKSRLALQSLNNKLELYYNAFNANGSREIYILSDDEIKEGDWNLWRLISGIGKEYDWNISQYYSKKSTQGDIERKKIVATTDKSLKINKKESTGIGYIDSLPQIPESLIQDYIKSYNLGKPITEVDLNMQIKEWGEPNNITGTLNPTWEVQTTHDNKVVVHNKMYSRSDVEKLINSAFKAGVFQGMSIFNQKDLDKWMQDNL